MVTVAGCWSRVVRPPFCPQAVGTPLLPHQKQALSWMCARENKCTLPPFWEKKGELYYNRLTCFSAKEMPESVCGGILADDMGLVSPWRSTRLLPNQILLNENMTSSPGKDSDHYGAHTHQLSWWKPSTCGDVCKWNPTVLCFPLPSNQIVLIQVFYAHVCRRTSLHL